MEYRKSKVLFLLHLPPPVHGAAMVGKFIKESDQINQQFKTRYINLGTSREVDDIGRGGLAKWGRYASILWNTFYALLTFRPNLVYITLTANGTGFYKDAVIALLAKVFGKKVIYHFHNKGVNKRQDKTFDNWLYQRVFDGAEVILLSPHLYYDIEKYIPEEKVHYCPNGIPEMEIDSKKALKNEKSTVHLLFLSNLIKSKGVFILLKACKILKERGLNFHCTFVGGEGDVTVQEFEHRVDEWSLQKVATYAGKKYGEEKERILESSDIFVFPTFYPKECFPLVLLEAMQASLPLVSTKEGGIPEIIEDGKNGYIVPPKDQKILADKLETLIEDKKLRKRMGANGRILYKKRFTVEMFEKRLAEILTNASKSSA